MKQSSLVFVRAVVALGLSVALVAGALVIWRSLQAMRTASEEVRAEHEFRFTVRPLTSTLNTGFEAVSSPAVFLQAARFQDHLYLAGPAGLQEYSPDGSLLHQYAVGSDLPGSPLVALVPAARAHSRDAYLV